MKLHSRNEGRCEEALQLIRARACEGVSVEEILEGLPISRATLDRQFKLRLGHTSAKELVHVRLIHAKQLLTTTHIPIKQVAQMVGCQGAANFCNFFRDKTGLSPGEFRSFRSGLSVLDSTMAMDASDRFTKFQKMTELNTRLHSAALPGSSLLRQQIDAECNSTENDFSVQQFALELCAMK